MEIDKRTDWASALVYAARMMDAVVVAVCDAADSSSCFYDDAVRTKTKTMMTNRLWLVNADEASTRDEDYEDDESEEEKDEQQTDELQQWQLKKTPMNKSTTTRLTTTSAATCCSS